MKFRRKHDNVILEPRSEIVVEQLRKNPEYEAVKEDQEKADTSKTGKAKGDKSK